ncbi:CPBP family intramembrane glutamic endopeptidase [Clostridium perfringens]|uniref:CPBP family intramembrane glutamic endopeptidase n=1 Tax=Clostridium perfringens TaxID=1502 RepID=UPI000D71C6BD|nr:CPBP family intramembrane glutamic endopeptidase [Clostridium perfringens]MDK0873659.1 CPBP family intramembrane metalloprotease [Clostridium perfringens]PWX10500.1 CPBP family intramembrane metalloprotease [Clostridium perfringens]PWX53968.1 CPBP family intramembrane metalloprotease [Clostridium perfringens]QUD74590.1 CPBP family intramembrane metalloprotease [Clostridium perfringens]
MKIIKDIKINWKLIAWYTIILVAINLVLSFIPSLFISIGNEATIEKISLLNFLQIVFFAPFFEETLMRGILQNFLEKKTFLTRKTNYILIALVFSMLHFDINFLPYFATSLILSYVYDKTNKTLIIPIMIHSLYNLFVTLIICTIN